MRKTQEEKKRGRWRGGRGGGSRERCKGEGRKAGEIRQKRECTHLRSILLKNEGKEKKSFIVSRQFK